MTELEKLHALQQAYRQAIADDRQACARHIELADRRENGENVSQAEVEALAEIAWKTYDARMAAYQELDQHKAVMLQAAEAGLPATV